jgi:hypothetical protein
MPASRVVCGGAAVEVGVDCATSVDEAFGDCRAHCSCRDDGDGWHRC